MKLKFMVHGLRELCIRNNFYTRGNNAEYSKLLAKEGLLDLDEIHWCALDIFAHSKTYFTVKDIVEAILNECAYILVEE